MTMRPDLTVAAVIERDGQFLFVEERAGARMVFNQPAGHVERGELLIDAVVRETLEETAWTFTPQALVGIYLWEQPQKQRTFLRFAFCGQVSGHDPSRALDHGIERTVWMSREQLVARSSRLRSPMVLTLRRRLSGGAPLSARDRPADARRISMPQAQRSVCVRSDCRRSTGSPEARSGCRRT